MSAGIPAGNVQFMCVFQLSIDIANSGAATTTVTSVTVPGVRSGDLVFVNKPSHTAGVGIGNVRVSAADTIEITTVNPTAGAVNPAAETYTLMVIRPETTVGGLVM